MKKNTKKMLTLNSETVRGLTRAELDTIEGGAIGKLSKQSFCAICPTETF